MTRHNDSNLEIDSATQQRLEGLGRDLGAQLSTGVDADTAARLRSMRQQALAAAKPGWLQRFGGRAGLALAATACALLLLVVSWHGQQPAQEDSVVAAGELLETDPAMLDDMDLMLWLDATGTGHEDAGKDDAG